METYTVVVSLDVSKDYSVELFKSTDTFRMQRLGHETTYHRKDSTALIRAKTLAKQYSASLIDRT